MQEPVAGAFRWLAHRCSQSTESDAIVAVGALPRPVALLGSGHLGSARTSNYSFVESAAASQHAKDAIIAALPGLVALLGSSHLDVQDRAAGALWKLAEGSSQRKSAVIAARACQHSLTY